MDLIFAFNPKTYGNNGKIWKLIIYVLIINSVATDRSSKFKFSLEELQLNQHLFSFYMQLRSNIFMCLVIKDFEHAFTLKSKFVLHDVEDMK